MRAGVAVAALALVAMAAATNGRAEGPFHARDPTQWGEVMRSVEPHYPPQALAAGRTGQPSEARVTNRVSFKITSGQPEIRVTLVKADGVRLEEFIPLERGDPVYPVSMRRAGAESVVYTRLRVDPEGSVTSVEPRAYPARGATREFEHEVIRALSSGSG